MAMARGEDEVYRIHIVTIDSLDHVKTMIAIVRVHDVTTTGIRADGITTVDTRMADKTIAIDRLASATRTKITADWAVVVHTTSMSLQSSSKVEV
jgi:uncharacterized protein YegL